MANIYNSDITTRVLEPSNHSNGRTEFRLDNNSCYLSNLRLINVGGTTNDGAYANQAEGPRCVIKQIELYSGNQLLDQIVNFNQWDVFRTMTSSNDSQLSKGQALRQTEWGFVAAGQADWADPDTDPDPSQSSIKVTKLFTQGASNLPAVADLKKTAWVSLQDVFSFLASSIHLPTGILKDLRLVVIYNNLAEMNKLSTRNDQTAFAPTRPLLIADEVNPGPMFDSFVASYKGVNYTPVEGDRVIQPAIALGDLADTAAGSQLEKNSNNLMNGFTNKYVEKLVIMFQGTDANTWVNPVSAGAGGGAGANYNNALVGALGSSNQWRQRVQVRVNGANKLPRQGLEGKNRTLAMLADHYADYVNSQASNWVGVQDRTQVTTLDPSFGNYVCIPVEENVSELQITYQRYGIYGATAASNAGTRQQLVMNVFGIVRKSLMVRDNGSFVIQYV